jgi:integrase
MLSNNTMLLFTETCCTLGLRIGEILRLRVADVFNNGIFVTNEKLRGQRIVVPVPEKLSRLMAEYIRQNNLRQDDYLFQLNHIQTNKTINDLCKEKGFKSYTELRQNVWRKMLSQKDKTQ